MSDAESLGGLEIMNRGHRVRRICAAKNKGHRRLMTRSVYCLFGRSTIPKGIASALGLSDVMCMLTAFFGTVSQSVPLPWAARVVWYAVHVLHGMHGTVVSVVLREDRPYLAASFLCTTI